MRRTGSRQNSPTPQGPAQIPSHDLWLLGTSPVSPTTPLINLPSPASDPDWTFPKGYLRGFSPAQSSHLHRSGGQWLSSTCGHSCIGSGWMVPQLRSHCLTGCQGEKNQLPQEGSEGISQRGHLSENLRGSLMTEKAKNGRQGLGQLRTQWTGIRMGPKVLI